jgi:hypothetical protein
VDGEQWFQGEFDSIVLFTFRVPSEHLVEVSSLMHLGFERLYELRLVLVQCDVLDGHVAEVIESPVPPFACHGECVVNGDGRS